jgi:hypothetical protein
MKRSEMIKLIHNSLNVYLEDTYKNVAMDISETILDNLEKCGMLPPETDAIESDFFTQGLSMEFLKNHDFKVNRWEPEDET